jgi:hypothetical protein
MDTTSIIVRMRDPSETHHPRSYSQNALSRSLGPTAPEVEEELQRMQVAFVRNIARDLKADRCPSGRVEASGAAVNPADAFTTIEERTLAQVQQRMEVLKGEYLDRCGPQLNADNASELFDDYAATLETRALLGPSVRKAAAAVVDALFADLIAARPPSGRLPLVVFTAGGNGAGKSSSLPAADTTQAYIQFDSTLSSWEPSLGNIERALAAGFHVLVSYIWRDPIDALVHGTLPRAMRIGRTVPLASHSRTHPGARQTVLALLQRYRDDPRVTIAVFENPESSVNPCLVRRDQNWLLTRPEDRPEIVVDRLRTALMAEKAGRRINTPVHRGTFGSSPDALNARRSTPG